ncbi:MAG TPA: M36 family metallopeptidase, partial [Nannocystis sp.]
MLLSLVAPTVHASERATAGDWRPAATGPGAIAPLAATAARGGASFYWSPTPEAARRGMSAEEAARFHVWRHRKTFSVGRAALSGVRLRFVHDQGRGGKIAVLRQSVGGVELHRSDIKVLMDRDHRLLAISGAPHPGAHAASARPFTQTPVAAITGALRDLHRELAAPRLIATGVTRAGYAYYQLAPTPGLRLRRPARVKPVYYPIGESLVPAHLVELQVEPAAGALEVYEYVVAADDGRVLQRNDLTAYEAFQYRTFADAGGDHRPFDGPLTDFTPHPLGVPGEGPKALNPPNLVTMEGFNSNPNAVADPWLPPGATETLGNNVDAYVDHKNPNGLQVDQGEFRAKVTAPGVFDYTYDVGKEPLANTTQSMAAITSLFYVTNWMHDWWYDSGFVEAAGNAQADNFGRGGVGNDPLRAEAQDAALVGTRNNANMATPADGESPTMQMYLWTPQVKTTLTLTPLDQSFPVNTAAFGPKNYDVTAPLVLMSDSGGVSPTDGCEAPLIDLAGKIVLVDRGNCTFETKSSKAQAAGALAVIIANNADGALSPGADNMVVDPTIPTQGITKVDGAALKAALAQPQTAHMFGSSSVERDGTIDNMIVAHEWGHFIHHRLVDCGANQCRAQSEGWGDFNAVFMALRDGDDTAGVYGSSPYASFDTTGYYGLRRVPYSVDMTKNALSLRHIGDGAALPKEHPLGPTGGPNSEVHNAGEVWATMMWEAYIAVIEAHPAIEFEALHRRMGDYVVSGMMLTPSDPTFTEQRDALLLAINANDPGDFLAVAQAFAKRGAGSCAVSPPRMSTDFLGVVEDFELSASGTITTVTLTDDVSSCDDDGIVDAGETGTLKVTVFNHGAAAVPEGSTVEVTNADLPLLFPEGASVALPSIAPLGTFVASLPIAVDELFAEHLPMALELRLTTPGGCEENFETFLRTDFNGDVLPASSTLDDVEAPPVWVTGGTEEGDAVWSRLASIEGHVWHGADVGRVSDTWLESPTFEVSDSEPLVFTWDHLYSFEFSDNIHWDGGVVEISSDDGVTWEDVTVYTKLGYDGAIASKANPLDKRLAFVDKNP